MGNLNKLLLYVRKSLFSKVSAEEKKIFLEHLKSDTRTGIQIGAALVIGLFFTFMVVDPYILPEKYVLLFRIVRIFVCATDAAIIYLLSKGYFEKWIEYVGLYVCLSVGLAIVAMVQVSGGATSPYYAGVSLTIVGFGVAIPWQLRYGIIASGVLYLSYMISSLIFSDIGQMGIFMNNNAFLLTNVVMSLTMTQINYKFRLNKFLSDKKLLDANENLKSLDKAKTRFFSNITHEFRTPLVALSSTIQMILSGQLSDKDAEKRLLEGSKESLEDMLENVNDLLTKSRSEKGMLEMKWAQIDIADFIARATRGFEPLAAKQHNRLRFINRLSSNADLLLICADRSKLKKVLNNLVGNAMKFAKNGEIEIILDETDTHCVIQVRDTGPGIPKEDLVTIFDPFTQASNNAMSDVQGTGLGLAMVKDFVEKHGGTVSVESEVGKGSIFTVLLPRGDAHVDKTKLDTTEILEGDMDARINLGLKSFDELDLSIFNQKNPQRHTLLLIEDNPQVLQALAYVLKDHYNLYFAKDGQEGFEKAQELNPDLIVTDVMMPRMNGYELVRAVKNNPDLKMTPIILLTSKADTESKIQGLEAGADEYLSKPFNNLEVLTRVKGLIERRKIEIEVIHAGKMVALGRFVAGMAHEINNPISFVKGSTDLFDEIFVAIKEGTIPIDKALERMAVYVERIKDGADRVAGITAALRSFVRQGETGFNFNDIHKGIESTILIVHTNRQAKVNFHQHYELEEEIVCNINQLNQVFLVLLDNAVQAFNGREDGDIWIHTYRQGDFAHITVRDNGPGIPEDIQGKIFDPCFTTKDVGQGTGLGLFIAQQIVHEHGGVLTVKSKVGEGAEFDIQLPIKGETGQHEQARFTHASIDRGVEKIRYPHR